MSVLFHEINLGGVTLKNRLVVAPMGMGHADDGGISDVQRAYLVERAKGGFGLIYPSAHTVSDRYEHPNTCGNHLTTPSHAKRLKKFADQVHQYGAKLAVQLTPGYGRVNAGMPGTMTEHVSASDNTVYYYPEEKCRPLEVDEIHELVQNTAMAAYYAKAAGVDIIEIHAYGGYLLDQFMSKCWNRRTDEYGGSFENRMRFTNEIHDAIRSVVGPNFPISIKLTPQHSFPGGRTLEDEGIEMVKYFEKSDYAYIHLDHGCYEVWNKAIPSAYEEPGCQLFVAERLREAGVKIPFLVQGKLNYVDLAERVISSGTADMIALGHQSIADPYWPRKVKQGRFEDIQHCMCCNECINSSTGMRNTQCAINPYTTNELEYKLEEPKTKRKVLVIGGGPGGMYTAKTAASLGHDTYLWEKRSRLGGLMQAAAAPDFKRDMHGYMEHLIAQVHKTGVKLTLGKEATVENVTAFAPDVVILAGGAQTVIPPIPGVQSKSVVTAYDLLANKAPTGENVVVIGGGHVGCEAALYLHEQGKNVTIVEMAPQILVTAGISHNAMLGLLEQLQTARIRIMESARVAEIGDGTVTVEVDGEQTQLPADNVVLASGFRADHTLEAGLKAAGCTVFTIGDNIAPGKVFQAVHGGFHTLRLLDDLIENY